LYLFEARDEDNYTLQQLYIDWRTTGIPSTGGDPDIDFDYDLLRFILFQCNFSDSK